MITHENLDQWSVDLDARGHIVENEDGLAFQGKGTASFVSLSGNFTFEVEIAKIVYPIAGESYP